jgi:hypothetical protein
MQVNLKWLQNLNQINRNKLRNIRHKTNKYLMNKAKYKAVPMNAMKTRWEMQNISFVPWSATQGERAPGTH